MADSFFNLKKAIAGLKNSLHFMNCIIFLNELRMGALLFVFRLQLKSSIK